VTPNKKAFSGSLQYYQQIQKECDKLMTKCCYECTVGAALPVIGTLQQLVRTGDEIFTIEGIFSGTLSYIFNEFSKEGNTRKFSEIVTTAKALGYTEPDPRDDLSGEDFARKVVILARECGLELSLKDINIPNLVPKGLTSCSVEDFMKQLGNSDLNDTMGQLLQQTKNNGEVLRMVGVIDVKAKNASLQIKRYPKSHAFAGLQGSDNIVLFTTSRYCNNPLIVRGPGAGSEVTAGGVFGDFLSILQTKNSTTAYTENSLMKSH